MGGVWERLIRLIRRVLSAVIRNTVLDDERLVTVFCEVEAIINTRPITPISSEPQDAEPLTPNHLLLLRGAATLPPGVFSMRDVYTRRWRHVQHLANRFWLRWVREDLSSIQHRQKWFNSARNFCVGDVVLVADETRPRNQWPLGRIISVFKGRDGLVRSALIKTQHTSLKRPISKLCFLEGHSA